MEITVRYRKSNRKAYTFETGNPLAIFVGYQRIDHEKFVCMEPDGSEYFPYECDKCHTKYGGHISNACPNCGRNS